MAMSAQDISDLITSGIPDAKVRIEDLRGDGDHYAAHIISPSFQGLSRIQQHQMVYKALQGKIGNATTACFIHSHVCRVILIGEVKHMENIIFEQIKKDITTNDVVLYMKGTAAFPQCGFSAAVVQVLSQLGVAFKDVNVLEDSNIRQGIKDFTNWPTIPQLYIKGEFVGGCDIVREMFVSGELQDLLKTKGVSFKNAA